MLLNYDDLPLTELQRRPTPARTQTSVGPAGLSRRYFLGASVLTVVATAGFQALKLVGGNPPAEAAHACWHPLAYKANCGYGAYYTTCTDGCPRAPDWDDAWYCVNAWQILSNHLACSDFKWWGNQRWNFEYRTDECYGSGHDGWLWYGVDGGGTCGCSNGVRFGCTDGYSWYQVDGVGAWYGPWSTICQTVECHYEG